MDMLDKLEQFRDERRELLNLEARIMQETQRANKEPVADVVDASDMNFPYIAGKVSIKGVDQRKARNIRKLRKNLRSRKKVLERRQMEIEEHVQAIPKSAVRQLVEFRYIQGHNWKSAATKVYGYPCEDRARKAVYRFYGRN